MPLYRGTGAPFPSDVHRCCLGCVPFSKARVPLLPIEGYPLFQGRTTLSRRTGTPISEGLKSPFPRDGCLFSQDRVPLPEDRYPIAREGYIPLLRGTARLTIFRETCVPSSRNGYPSSEGGVPIFRGTVVPHFRRPGSPSPIGGGQVRTVAIFRVPSTPSHGTHAYSYE